LIHHRWKPRAAFMPQGVCYGKEQRSGCVSIFVATAQSASVGTQR
jgi:hypothetical protein